MNGYIKVSGEMDVFFFLIFKFIYIFYLFFCSIFEVDKQLRI